MAITTSYFGKRKKPNGKKIAVTQKFPWFAKESEYEWRPEFAPSHELLRGYKNKRYGWQQYTERYYAEQRDHFRTNPTNFRDLLGRGRLEDVVLCCYERCEGTETKCHRTLLYDILQKVAKKWQMDVQFIEEK
jgi:uncharacterized protein YeaO (DUF488 family)